MKFETQKDPDQNFAERLTHRVLTEIFLKFKFQIGNIWFPTLPSNRLPKRENKIKYKKLCQKKNGANNFQNAFLTNYRICDFNVTF